MRNSICPILLALDQKAKSHNTRNIADQEVQNFSTRSLIYGAYCILSKSSVLFIFAGMQDTTTKQLASTGNGLMDERLKTAFEAGLHYGRVRRLMHPKMEQFILTTKGDIQIINLAKTLEMLDSALEFLKEIASRGGIVLLVGIQPAARELVKEFGQKLGLPYVNERWLGGTLTNFRTLSNRIQYLKDLEAKVASEEFLAYTKKERHKMQVLLHELREKFEGLRDLTKLPDAVFLIGLRRHETALREARRLKIPIIAVCNTNDDPTLVDYPIPANDNSAPGIRFILEEISKVWKMQNTQIQTNNQTNNQTN